MMWKKAVAKNTKTAAQGCGFVKESKARRRLLLGLGGGLFGERGGCGLATFVVGDAALLLDVFVRLLAHRFEKLRGRTCPRVSGGVKRANGDKLRVEFF
jgi:hypothetical protein